MDRKRIKTELLIHDIKNPLAVIETGILSLIQGEDKYGRLSEKQHRILQRALRNTKIAKTLVNDMLEVGRSTEGVIQKKYFFVSDFVRSTLLEIFDVTDYKTAEMIKGSSDLLPFKDLLKQQGISLEVDADLWSREVSLDERKVKQIFRNLLTNAMKYRKQRIVVKVDIKDGFFYVSVSDDGEGIEKAFQEKVFDCYFQLDQEKHQCVRGHGLGLAGALILVEDMGGSMGLESDAGKGADFFVKLPLND
ncbi:MAG: HAMP domain-containing histidine kinase [Deltaproteobacteria bacterium]|nr:HAMP domain-containing histidine kinase [Deltaproteobacteria bacterium]